MKKEFITKDNNAGVIADGGYDYAPEMRTEVVITEKIAYLIERGMYPSELPKQLVENKKQELLFIK